MTFNAAGSLYVANYGSGTIQTYSNTGSFLSTFATGLSGPTRLVFGPASVAGAPEPSEWAALGFTGLGIDGLLLRARRRKADAA